MIVSKTKWIYDKTNRTLPEDILDLHIIWQDKIDTVQDKFDMCLVNIQQWPIYRLCNVVMFTIRQNRHSIGQNRYMVRQMI